MFIGRNNLDKHHLYGPNSIYTLDFDIVGKAKAKAKARYLELPHVLDRGISMTTCNGLICYALTDQIVICNPATHNYRLVPLFARVTSPYEFGFGYDYSTDDYKVVTLEPRGGGGGGEEEKYYVYSTDDYKVVTLEPRGGGGGEEEKYYVYQVYSMKSDTWGIRRRKNGIWSTIRTPVYAGGSLYWVDSDTDDAWNAKYRIIAYDLVRDKWGIQLVPEPIRKSGYMHLSNHRGSLCVSCVKSFTTHLEFWLLENHQGIKYSWSKLFLMKETQRSMAIDIITPPMGNLKRKRGVLFNDCDVVKWYDFKKRKTEVIDIVCEANVSNMFTCYESLVRV